MKKTNLAVFIFGFFVLLASFIPFLSAESADQPKAPKEPVINFLLRNNFYFSPDQKIKFNTRESDGFLLVPEKRPDMNSSFALVSGFDGSVLETQALKDVNTIEEAHTYLKDHSKVTRFMNVMIKEVQLPTKDGNIATRYWVGEQSFPSLDLAQASIVSVKTSVESQGGSFDRATQLIEEFAPAEPKATTEEQVTANFEREEKVAIKAMEWLHIGDRYFGPFNTPKSVYGENPLWQSFGSTSFRFTNLERDEYYAQVGYWTNRVVLKGIRGPNDTTFDPYIEVTPALESNGLNYKSNLQLNTGVQWYPLIRNAWLQNVRGPGGIPWLNFARSYRVFAQYMWQENLKDEITNARSTNVRAGVDIFYEWGLDLHGLDVEPPKRRFVDYVTDYVWGEYYGAYRYDQTDFSPIKNYNSFIINNSIILGIKWPSFQLPENPVNPELTFMPYLRFENVTNPMHSLFYQNYYFVAGGVRFMPFRSHEFEENEWLFKTKLFFEYIGLGGVARPSANTPIDTPERDYRFGVEFSYRRF